jgi:hypothetical protein
VPPPSAIIRAADAHQKLFSKTFMNPSSGARGK